jgi:hypothetical protein
MAPAAAPLLFYPAGTAVWDRGISETIQFSASRTCDVPLAPGAWTISPLGLRVGGQMNMQLVLLSGAITDP